MRVAGARRRRGEFCARCADDIQKICSIITVEGGIAKGYACDLNQPDALSEFSSQQTSPRTFNSQCCSAAVRNVRRSAWHRNNQHYQFRTDRFNFADSGIAARIKTFIKCGYCLNYFFGWDSKFYVLSCAPIFLILKNELADLQINFPACYSKRIYVWPGFTTLISNWQD